MRKHQQVRVKATKNIVAEAGDENYFRQLNFPSTALGDYQEKDSNHVIRMSFLNDIAKKYDLPRERIAQFFFQYNLEIIRSLAVFGDHEYIVDKIRAALRGTF